MAIDQPREYEPLSPSTASDCEPVTEESKCSQLYCHETLDDLEWMQEQKYGEPNTALSTGPPVAPLISPQSVSSTAATVVLPVVGTDGLGPSHSLFSEDDLKQPSNSHLPSMQAQSHNTRQRFLRGWAVRSDRQPPRLEQQSDTNRQQQQQQASESGSEPATEVTAPPSMSTSDIEDPTQRPTGFHCSQCGIEFKMGQTWFACNECDDLDLCPQCRRSSTHPGDKGHTFSRRECRGRNAARRTAMVLAAAREKKKKEEEAAADAEKDEKKEVERDSSDGGTTEQQKEQQQQATGAGNEDVNLRQPSQVQRRDAG
jgi:hypothetical protein